MATELYDLTIPVFLRGLRALKGLLEKGEAFAAEQGIDPADLTAARLIEDMHPLTAQIQRASDASRLAAIRLGELAPLPMPDEETTFAELKDRVQRTIDFLETVKPEQLNGREDATVVLEFPGNRLEFRALDYALGFALPNFWFHVTTAYGLLRMKGVPIGKRDFLAGG